MPRRHHKNKTLKSAAGYVAGHISNVSVAGHKMVVRKLKSGKKEWAPASKMEVACAKTLRNKIKKFTEESRKKHKKGTGHHIFYPQQAVPAAIKYTAKKFPKCQLVTTRHKSRKTGKMVGI